jgi:hypothetical protein
MSDTSRIDKSNPENFLDNMYDTMFNPQIQAVKSIDTWVVDELHYPGYKKFLPLFEKYDDRHIDYGNGMLYYKNNMAYPNDLDPKLDYHAWIKFQLQNVPITVKEFKKAWGVKYPPGGYSGLHCHQPGKQLTSVMFLDTPKPSIDYPLAGSLTTLQPTPDSTINYLQHKPIAGRVVIMDGKVFHGTYPTLEDRHVFVCDFDYESIVT